MQSNTPILHRVVLHAGLRGSKLVQIDWSALCNSHHAPPVVAERERARLKVVPPESPPPLAGNGLALVDAVIVQQLTRDVGIQRLPAVLGAFVAELGRRIPLVRTAIDEHDLQLLGRESHSLKGSALTFGAPALAAVARAADDAFRRGDDRALLEASAAMVTRGPETSAAIAALIAALGEELEDQTEGEAR